MELQGTWLELEDRGRGGGEAPAIPNSHSQTPAYFEFSFQVGSLIDKSID